MQTVLCWLLHRKWWSSDIVTICQRGCCRDEAWWCIACCREWERNPRGDENEL